MNRINWKSEWQTVGRTVVHAYCVLILGFLSSYASAADAAERKSLVERLNETAQEVETKLRFSQDPNQDTTMFLYRTTTFRPEELPAEWEFFLWSVGSSIDELKDAGFTAVRIYTSKSEGVADYALKAL
ncbi:MAG: hypothetical protein AAF662_02820 [Pseudomonadota bacterium]